MKRRILASLLSVTILFSNLGINTYAMEEVGESMVTEEAEKETELSQLLMESGDKTEPSEEEELFTEGVSGNSTGESTKKERILSFRKELRR